MAGRQKSAWALSVLFSLDICCGIWNLINEEPSAYVPVAGTLRTLIQALQKTGAKSATLIGAMGSSQQNSQGRSETTALRV